MPKLKKPQTLDAWTNELATLTIEHSTCKDRARKVELTIIIEKLTKEAALMIAKDNGLNKINKMLSSAQSKLIEAMKEGGTDSDSEAINNIDRYNAQVSILEEAIQQRHIMHRDRSYFLEQQVAGAGIFSVPKPNRKKETGLTEIQGRNSTIRIFKGGRVGPTRHVGANGTTQVVGN